MLLSPLPRSSLPLLLLRRGLSTQASPTACQLSFDTVHPSTPDKQLKGQSLVICHGLLYVSLILLIVFLIPKKKKKKELTHHVYVVCMARLYSGSKQNWRSLSKTFAKRLGIPIYTLVRAYFPSLLYPFHPSTTQNPPTPCKQQHRPLTPSLCLPPRPHPS